ncbi:MAG: AAA family ATPase [bacterium]|nr:AAA family ATPase [bacterium]
MIINSIKLQNIRSYLNQKIDFPQGAVLLSGDIGSGKSTTLLAIEFALFGIIKGSVDGAALLRHGKNTGNVELSFNIDKKEVLIKRVLKRSKKGVSQDAGYIIIDGVKTAGTPVELKSRVIELLGYPKELLSKSKSLIYRYTVYTPQEEMKQILLEEKGYRLDTLRKVFQIDKYKKIRENAQIAARSLRERQKELSGKIEDLGEKKEQKKKVDEQLKKSEVDTKKIEPELELAKKNIAEKKSAAEEIDKKIIQLNDLKRKADVAEMRIKEKAELVNYNNKEIKNIDERITVIKTKIKDVKQDYNEVKKGIIDAKEKLDAIKSELKKNEAYKEASEKVKKAILELDNCPLCLQNVSKQHKEDIHKAESDKISVACKAMEEKIAAGKDIEEKLKTLEALKETLDEQKHFVEMLKEKESDKKRLEEKQILLKKEVGAVNSEKLKLYDEIKALGKIDESAVRVKKEMEAALAKEKDLLVKKAALDNEIRNLSENIKLLDLEILKKTEAKKQLEALNDMKNWINDYFVNLMDVIEKHVMSKVYQEFNEFFQKWFNVLMEDESISVRLDEEFAPVIEQNGYETSLENLSGGEKTSCALAYRLALNKVINELISTIKTRDLIVLDEPTDGFSTEQLEKVREVIEALKMKQVIVVSHEEKIESFVDKVIRVVKEEHTSHIAE